MKNEKIANVLRYYLLTSKLKDLLRQGAIAWHISKERLESVAEHILGTINLAIAIDSEFDLEINIDKVIKMLAIHETEEIIIGDLTLLDEVSKKEGKKQGRNAVNFIFRDLIKKDEYISLIDEFNERKSNDAIFAYMCDKIENDIQFKIYEDEGYTDINNPKLKDILNDERVKKIINNGANTIADIFIEYDRFRYKDTIFEDILDYIKNNNTLDIKKENDIN